VASLRWIDEGGLPWLELLDQRALPLRVATLRCGSASEVAQAIRDMVVRGAPAIGVAAAYGMALEALAQQHAEPAVWRQRMAEADATLRASRPTAVNLFWALDAMQRELVAHADAGVADQAQALVRRAQQLQVEDVVVNQQMGAHGAALLPADALVLTHCNAGALATAGYGTALGVIRAAIAQGKRVRVLADETRPLLQGARLTAWELHAEGIDVTLITDNAAGHLMQHERIDAVVVGTDRVAANGDVANKIGTYMVAVLAQRHGIPFYVACPTSTIDMALPTGADIPIEERHASEVRGHGTTTWAPPGVAVRNPAFDVTPAELVTALITERGVWHQPNSARMQAWMQAG